MWNRLAKNHAAVGMFQTAIILFYITFPSLLIPILVTPPSPPPLILNPPIPICLFPTFPFLFKLSILTPPPPSISALSYIPPTISLFPFLTLYPFPSQLIPSISPFINICSFLSTPIHPSIQAYRTVSSSPFLVLFPSLFIVCTFE